MDDKTSLKSFNATDVAATTDRKQQAGCAVNTTPDTADDCGECANSSPYKGDALCLSRGTAPSHRNQKPGEGPRESKHLQEDGRDK